MPETPLFLNRELSLLAFHRRVLAVAEDPHFPLLERLRFLCISASNLDEFFEVRVASLLHKRDHGILHSGVDHADIPALLAEINQRTREMLAAQYRLLNETLLPALAKQGVTFLPRDEWTDEQRSWLRRHMFQQFLPVISPLGIDPAHPFPRVINRNLHFIVSLEGKDAFGREHRVAIVPIPRSLPRLIRLPEKIRASRDSFVFLSSIIHAFVSDLFPGMTVTGCYQFQVTRDSELYLDEEEMADLKQEVKGRLQTSRRFGRAVRLQVAANCPESVSRYLLENFDLPEDALFRVDGPVNLHRLAEACDAIDRKDLKLPGFKPSLPPEMLREEDMFRVLKRRDILIHHPFQSFTAVVRLLEQAAVDPDVLAIKQTLYRTGHPSPIVDALCRAARNGKEVSVVVELRARFDEEGNIRLAETLQQAGAHVVYGVVGHKTHAKMLVIVRREGGRISRYSHLATGNYHEVTSRIYTDFGFLTNDELIGGDVIKLFQELTGLGRALKLKRLVQAPFDLQRMIVDNTEREIEHVRSGGRGRIIAKMNGLEDPEIIEAFYRASRAGVRIDLIVRGVCCLRPGVKGLSENIRVRSVLGRFLEHTRIFYFRNDGRPDVYCSSADCLVRNLHRRVETAFPIPPGRLQQRVVREGLRYYLRDTAFSWRLRGDGRYLRRHPRKGQPAFSAQQTLLETYGIPVEQP